MRYTRLVCLARLVCPARLVCLFGVLCVTSVLGGGCVQTAMLPAQQLESGTTVVSGSIDEPGVQLIPRLNAQVTKGFGRGDLTVNLSSVPSLYLGTGLTGRYYLTNRANAELQVQVREPFQVDRTGLFLFGLQSVPTGSEGWYLGGQMGVVRGPGPFGLGKRLQPVETLPAVGATLGYGPVNLGSSWRMQVELETHAPIPLSGESSLPPPATRLSVGVFGVFR